MMAKKNSLQSTVDDIARRRDELRLKIHLAKADARAEWEKAEAKWTRVQSDLARVKESTSETLDDVREGVQHLAAEIGDAYERIRRTLRA